MSLIESLKSSQKDAMFAVKNAANDQEKNDQKIRLGSIRMVLAAIKQREVDERIELNDEDVIAILTKMVKQRKDSFNQYQDAGRLELADKEAAEIKVIEAFLPQALTEDEVSSLIANAIQTSGAAGMQDMGKVMAILKPQITGRADMGKVSGLVRAQLNS